MRWKCKEQPPKVEGVIGYIGMAEFFAVKASSLLSELTRLYALLIPHENHRKRRIRKKRRGSGRIRLERRAKETLLSSNRRG